MSKLPELWRRTRLALVLSLAPWLSACWISTEPLIGTETASQVSFAGAYKPDGYEVAVRASRKPDGSYELTDGKDGFTGFYREIGDRWYVVQIALRELARDGSAQAGAGDGVALTMPFQDGPWLYNLLRVNEQSLEFYQVACDEETRGIAGVTTEQGLDDQLDACVLSSVAQVDEAAQRTIGAIATGAFTGDKRTMRVIE